MRALRLVGNTLYLAGAFSNVQGMRHPLVTAVELTTGQVVSNVPMGSEYYGQQPVAGVWAIGATETDILIVGEFFSLGGAVRHNLAALSAETGQLLSWAANASGPVYALAYGTKCVYVGGAFTNLNGMPTTGLVALDPLTSAPFEGFAFTATNDYYSPVIYCLLLTDTKLYLGGSFTGVGGKSARSLAAVNPATAAPSDFAPDVRGGSRGVVALALGGETLYLGGDFTQVGGKTCSRLAAVNAADGKVLDWNPNPNQEVKTLSLQGDRLYVGGSFRRIAEVELRYLALFEVPSLTLLPLDAALSQNASSFEVINALDTAVYVGGILDGIGGEFRQAAAALGPFTAQAFEWDPAPWTYPPVVIGISDSLVCLGGAFPLLGRTPEVYTIGYLAAYYRAPVFTTNSLVGGKLKMESTTGDRIAAILQGSPDFKTWSNVATNDNPGYRWSIEQTIQTEARTRFFRVRAE